jgi:hypothetical protein
MGNASSSGHDGEAPVFNPETIVQDAVRICQKSFFYGVGKNFPFSIDLGVALGGEVMHQKDGSVALLGFYRQRSWARHSPMYPIEFVFSRKNDSAFAVQVRGTVKYVGAGGGWAHVGEDENFEILIFFFFPYLDVDQSFDGEFDLVKRQFSGYWRREESRSSGNSTETLSGLTGGYYLDFCGKLEAEHVRWTPQRHAQFRINVEFDEMVKTLLLMHNRRDCEFSRLPKDLVYLLISDYLAGTLNSDGTTHPKFAEIMVDADQEDGTETLLAMLMLDDN